MPNKQSRMDMDDLIQSMKAYLYDRASSPLAGTILFTSLLLNHRVFFVLFSGDNYEANFAAIDEMLSINFVPDGQLINQWLGKLTYLLVLPAVIAGLYIWLYPRVAEPVYRFTLERAQKLRSIKQEIQNERLLTVKESRELYQRIADIEKEYSELEERKNREIQALRESLRAEDEQPTKGPRDPLESSDWHADEADPEEYDSHIDSQIARRPAGKFELQDLFSPTNWDWMSDSNKTAVEERLKMRVDRGDFVGVRVFRMSSDNTMVFEKVR